MRRAPSSSMVDGTATELTGSKKTVCFVLLLCIVCMLHTCIGVMLCCRKGGDVLAHLDLVNRSWWSRAVPPPRYDTRTSRSVRRHTHPATTVSGVTDVLKSKIPKQTLHKHYTSSILSMAQEARRHKGSNAITSPPPNQPTCAAPPIECRTNVPGMRRTLIASQSSVRTMLGMLLIMLWSCMQTACWGCLKAAPRQRSCTQPACNELTATAISALFTRVVKSLHPRPPSHASTMQATTYPNQVPRARASERLPPPSAGHSVPCTYTNSWGWVPLKMELFPFGGKPIANFSCPSDNVTIDRRPNLKQEALGSSKIELEKDGLLTTGKPNQQLNKRDMTSQSGNPPQTKERKAKDCRKHCIHRTTLSRKSRKNIKSANWQSNFTMLKLMHIQQSGRKRWGKLLVGISRQAHRHRHCPPTHNSVTGMLKQVISSFLLNRIGMRHHLLQQTAVYSCLAAARKADMRPREKPCTTTSCNCQKRGQQRTRKNKMQANYTPHPENNNKPTLSPHTLTPGWQAPEPKGSKEAKNTEHNPTPSSQHCCPGPSNTPPPPLNPPHHT